MEVRALYGRLSRRWLPWRARGEPGYAVGGAG